MQTLLISLALAFVVIYARDSDSYYSDAFDSWAIQHGKVYEPEQRQYRLENFKSSIKRIADLNERTGRRGVGATYGLNKFSDLTPEEFAATVLMKPFKGIPDSVKRQNMLTLKKNIASPDTFDWRSKGAVTPVKDQAQCGSCWAFSVTENVESVWMLAKGLTNETMTHLSPQQIVDCDESDAGCNGGDTPTAYDYIKSAGGLEPEKDYPYTAKDGRCSFKASDVFATISSWKYATTYWDETTLKDNLAAWAPLSICVDARYWQDYQSGVMTAYECDWIVEIDHCVQAVGYDLTASTPYWIVRNSWGTDWGEKGYILIEYGQNSCGLTSEATTAVV